MAVAFSTDLSTFVPERPIYAVGENSDGSLSNGSGCGNEVA